MTAAYAADGNLAREFCVAIDTCWACSCLFNIWSVSRSVENIVCRDVYNPSVTAVYGFGKISWCKRVEGGTDAAVTLCFIDSGVCRTVYYTIYIVFCNEIPYSALVCDI